MFSHSCLALSLLHFLFDPLSSLSNLILTSCSTENKKAYRYMHCVADSAFPHSNWYRNSDEKPFTPHMSFSDSDKWFHFDESARVVTNEKGWRMGRGNVVAREGSYYYEVKILKGVPSEEKPASPVTSSPTVGKDDPLASSIIQNGTITPANGSMSNGISRRPSGPSPIVGPTPHVRIGWARREAPLDAPVGFDGYSYGLTDSRMEPMHKSRAHKFLDNGDDKPPPASKQKPKSKTTSKSKSGVATAAGTKSGPGASDTAGQFSANDSVREGDTIGLSITLPSLSLHRKIASGQYNPLADVGAGLNSLGYDDGSAHNIVRDRFAVPYKNSMFFESIQYSSSKGMDGYGDRGPFSKETPSTNHSDPTLRSLPGSNIKVWKNGKLIGTAFRDLMAFLPPCSQPAAEKGVRSGLDDGMVGYYPAIGVFSGAIAEVNFGPDFWCKPQEVEWAPSTAEKCDTMGNKDTTDSVDVTMKETGGDEDTTDKGPGSDTQVKNETAEDTTMQNAEDTSGAATNSPTDKTSSNSPETATQPNQHKSTSPQVEQQKSNGSRRASSGRKITLPSLAPICERYKEQIAEDVVYDVIDEASFWVSDGAPATS